jgi:hypothetical protein
LGWSRIWRRLGVMILILCSLPSCSVNILETFADPLTNDALLYAAKQLMNEHDFNGAIDKFDLMTPEYLSKAEVRAEHASAYLGICSGLTFIEFIDELATISTRFMPWMVATFTGGNAAKQTACIQAETIIKSIATLGVNRTVDENLLMAMVGIAKMGIILSRYSDTAPANGTADAGFDPCLAAGTLPLADARQLATGFNIAIDALENIGSLSLGGSTLSDISTLCGASPLCTDPPQVAVADIDATEEDVIRSIIKEDQDVGLGTNCAGDITVCNCP